MNYLLRIVSILSLGIAWSPGAAAAPTGLDPSKAITQISKTLKGQKSQQPVTVAKIVCPNGLSVTPLLVTGLRDHGIQASSEAERQKEVTKSLEAEKQSQAHPFRLAGSCTTEGKSHRLDLRLTEIETGRILSSYTSQPNTQNTGHTEAISLLTQLRRLSDEVISNLDRMDGNLRYQRFAVANFEEIGQSTQDKQLGLVVAAQLQSMLQNDHNLFLVEREEVARLVDEIQLGQMGLVSEKDAVEIGKMSGAQALILGSVSEAGAHYVVNLRIVSVSGAEVWATAETTLPASDLIALSSEAAVLRTRAGAMYRALLLPGWGQFYNRDPFKGAVFAGSEVVTAGLSAMFHLMGAQAQSDYDALDASASQEQFETFRDDASQHYKLRNVFLYATIAIHVFGFIDATLEGYGGDSSSSPGNTGAFSWSF